MKVDWQMAIALIIWGYLIVIGAHTIAHLPNETQLQTEGKM